MSDYQKDELLDRITIVLGVFGGKPVIRGRRLAVEHVLDMLAAGDRPETILSGYPWLDLEDIHACVRYQQWFDRVEGDWVESQEWEVEVEEGDLGRADETGDVDSEWAGSVEPDYDSEEEKLTVAASAGRRVIGYA